jgi:hypothetical protein
MSHNSLHHWWCHQYHFILCRMMGPIDRVSRKITPQKKEPHLDWINIFHLEDQEERGEAAMTPWRRAQSCVRNLLWSGQRQWYFCRFTYGVFVTIYPFCIPYEKPQASPIAMIWAFYETSKSIRRSVMSYPQRMWMQPQFLPGKNTFPIYVRECESNAIGTSRHRTPLSSHRHSHVTCENNS